MKKQRSLQLPDITGEKYASLTAIEFIGRYPNMLGTVYTWKCDCGNTIKYSASKVRNGSKRSCGCTDNRNNIAPGEKHNLLTAISYVKKDLKSKRSIWLWLCDCGKTVECSITSVRTGGRKSCGCQRLELSTAQLIKRTRKGEGESCKQTLYTRYKNEARKRNLPFELSKNRFGELIIQNCYYCNALPSNQQKVPWNNDVLIYTGVDRKNSMIGYVKNNVVPCCKICNLAKNKLSIEEFLNWIDHVYNHSIRKHIV